MKKTEKIKTLETAIYVLALTAARDDDTTHDKEVLVKIRDYMGEIVNLKGGSANVVTLYTIGMSTKDALKMVEEFDEQQNDWSEE